MPVFRFNMQLSEQTHENQELAYSAAHNEVAMAEVGRDRRARRSAKRRAQRSCPTSELLMHLLWAVAKSLDGELYKRVAFTRC
ncbi:MAG: hypothetical protein HQM09_14425 [Candidatus Riflebacteria bacterium]|nr:hypothetical protein [Candidatus Riflebacteria bacterium]